MRTTCLSGAIYKGRERVGTEERGREADGRTVQIATIAQRRIIASFPARLARAGMREQTGKGRNKQLFEQPCLPACLPYIVSASSDGP